MRLVPLVVAGICATSLTLEAAEPVSLAKVFTPDTIINLTPPARSGSVAQSIEKIKRPVRSKQWTKNTKVWLARSCVGESGFFAVDECMAIAWIYAKRAKLAGWPLLKMIRRYSAATKPHEVHRRPWLFELTAEAEKPKNWPDTIRWKYHRKAWLALLATLEDWQRGKIADPVPDADHYGSYRDANQSVRVRRWQRLEVPAEFKNLYFNSNSKHAKPVSKYTKYMINGRH